MIGIVIPTRGDREVFLNQCMKMLGNQTMPADKICIVNEEPKSDAKDITYRFKKGFKNLFDQGCEVVFLIEDDDYYCNDYIKVMYNNWLVAGKPQIFGLGNTTYYHLKRKCYTTMDHPRRSSAFSTMVTKDVMNIDWPADDYPFLDLELWKQLKGITFKTNNPIAVGIKHGVGLCGGSGHNETFRYENEDNDHSFLEYATQKEFKFYKNLVL